MTDTHLNFEKRPSFQNAIKWAYAASWGEKGLSALFMFLLAAVLGPRDFGTFSIAVVYISFLQMFLDQGLALALIQTRRLEPQHLDTVFWFDMALSGVFVTLGIILRNPLANLNHAPEAAVVIAALTPSIILEAAAIVPLALLRRQSDFKSISIRTNISMLAGGAVGTVLVFTGYRLWALVAQQLVRDSFAFVLLWRLTSWRPRWAFSWAHFRQLLPFSTANFVGQLGVFGDGQGTALLLGAMFGPTAVGIYRLGERITNSVITMSMASIQSAALPEFARLRDQPKELRDAGLLCVRLSSTVTVPALAVLASVAYPLMVVIGPRWVAAADVLRILALGSMVLVFSFFTGPLLQGLGLARKSASLEWSRVLAGLIALCIAGWLVRGSSVGGQVMGIALSKLLVAILFTAPVFVTILLKLCKISLRMFLSACLPSLAAAGCIVIAIYLVNKSLQFSALPVIVWLIVEFSVGVIIGLAVMISLDKQLRRSLSTLLRRSLKPLNANA